MQSVEVHSKPTVRQSVLNPLKVWLYQRDVREIWQGTAGSVPEDVVLLVSVGGGISTIARTLPGPILSP